METKIILRIALTVAMPFICQCIWMKNNVSSILTLCLTTNRSIKPVRIGCTAIWFVISALLLGCERQSTLPQDILEYQQRLANVLDKPPPDTNEITPLTYPSVRQLKADIARLNIELNEFYAIQDCAVAPLIAERNTALGRTQLPSTRYIYEVKLIEGLTSCWSNATDARLKTQLAEWLNLKNQSLTQVWADLIQTSSETRASMSNNKVLLIGNGQDPANEYFMALTFLLNLRDTPNTDTQQLETALNTLKNSPLPAQLWRTQRVLISALDSTTDWLALHEDALHCQSQKSEQQVTYLNNVFLMFFVQRIQPIAGTLNQYQYRLIPLLQRLHNDPVIHPQLKSKLNRHASEFNQYKASIGRHITLWQRLLRACNLSPEPGN